MREKIGDFHGDLVGFNGYFMRIIGLDRDLRSFFNDNVIIMEI